MERQIREQMIRRAVNFDEGSVYDGYQSMDCSDPELIHAAADESSRGLGWMRNPLLTLIYELSTTEMTPKQYDNARRYVREYVRDLWATNFSEGGSKVFEARAEAGIDADIYP